MGRSPKEIEDQITYPLSVNLQGLAGVKAVRSSQRVQLLDDQHHLRGQHRLLLRPAAGAGAVDLGQHLPAAGGRALHGPRRHGPGPDFLVHGRGRRAGPGPPAGHPGLVRPLPAQLGPRRGPGGLGRRVSHRIPDRRGPQQAPRLQRDPGRVVRGRRAVQLRGRRQGDPEGQRGIHRPRRRLDREHQGHREDRREGRPGKGHADLRLESRHGEPRGASSAAACWRRTATRRWGPW